MANRSTQSSSSASGSVNASGAPNDTIIVLGGTGRKTVLGIHWAMSKRGGLIIASDLLTSRIAVVAGVDLSQLLTANLAVGFTSTSGTDPLKASGGKLVFDTQVVGGANQNDLGFVVLPPSGHIPFDASAKEGRLEAYGGILSIIMTAPTGYIAGVTPSYIEGVLTVQYDTESEQTGAADGPPGYRYTPVSGKAT